MNVEKDESSHLDAEGLSQSLRELKEEVTGQDGTSIKPEVRLYLDFLDN